MVGVEDGAGALGCGVGIEAFVARYRSAVARGRDRGRVPQRAVAVDHQAGVALFDQHRVQRVRKLGAHGRDADIPGDVPVHVGGGDAERSEPPWHPAAGVVGQEEEGRPPGRVADLHGAGFIRSEEWGQERGRG